MRWPTAAVRAYAGFAAFGALWGVWGASVPAVRERAGLSDGQLGTALLFVGAGALPAMLLTGRAVDRWGHRLTALLLVALGGAGVGVARFGEGVASLSVGLAVLGAASGAVDVAINAAAGTAERASDRPVIARAHGVFSASVVVASLAGGALHGGGASVGVPFGLVALAAGVAGAVTLATAEPPEPPEPSDSPEPPGPAGRRRRPDGELGLLPLLVLGALGAVAFAVENAHQTWSAVYLGDVQSAGPALAAAGPAVFATVVALTRFTVASLGTTHATAVLVTGAAAAAAGTATVAGAPNVAIALVGLGLAAAGTAVLYPTLLGLAASRVGEEVRGRATSVVTTVAYLGFLGGPVYVGGWAAAVDLPGAMGAVAALAAGLALVTWPALRAIGHRTEAPAATPPGHRPRRTGRTRRRPPDSQPPRGRRSGPSATAPKPQERRPPTPPSAPARSDRRNGQLGGGRQVPPATDRRER